MRPELFALPWSGAGVPTYGLLVAFALILGWILALVAARRDRLPPDPCGTAYVFGVGAGLLGARGLWLLQHPQAWTGPADLLAIQAGGLAVVGGLVVGVVVASTLIRVRGLPWFLWLDTVAPAMLLAYAIERVGAFAAGTDFGKLAGSASPLAVRFPKGSPAWIWQRVNLQQLRVPDDASLPVHPSQLYGAAIAVAGFAVCAGWRSRRRATGELAMLALLGFVAARMVVEDAFRMDQSVGSVAGLGAGTSAAAAIAALVAAVWWTRRRQAAAAPQTAAQWRGGPWSPADIERADSSRAGRGGPARAPGESEANAELSGKGEGGGRRRRTSTEG